MPLMMTPDDETVLLAKAFGDLNTRPFAWCFESPDDHVNDSNNMIAADDHDDYEIFEANDPILEYADYPDEAFRAPPTPPTAATPSVTDQEPQEGVTYYMDGDAFLRYLRHTAGMPDDSGAASCSGSSDHCDISDCATLAPLHTCGNCGGQFCERHCDYQTTWYDDMPAHICYDCLRGEVDYIY